MKKHFLLMAVVSLLSLTEAHALNLLQRPETLELTKYLPVSGRLSLRHTVDNPKMKVGIRFDSKETNDLAKNLLEADINNISCDGDFDMMFDNAGYPFVVVHSIKACINEDGFVVAHSIGMPALSQDAINGSVRKILEAHEITKRSNVAINQSNAPKLEAEAPKAVANPNAGVFILPPKATSAK